MSLVCRRIQPAEYEAARALWDVVFPEDAAGFSAYYFRARTAPGNVLAAFDGESMVAALHAVPYPLRFQGAIAHCAMIAGVATLPEYRRKGIAGALIRRAHEELRESGAVAALLKPDVDFYAQFGYLPFSRHDEYALNASQAILSPAKHYHEPAPDEMLAIYDAFSKEYAGMMARTLRDMEAYLEEARLLGFAAALGGAYALCGADGDGVSVSELVGENPLPLVSALALEYGAVRFRLPAGMGLPGLAPASRMTFSMICPLDEARLLAIAGAGGVEALLSGASGQCLTLEFC